jgi:hypothetical protein
MPDMSHAILKTICLEIVRPEFDYSSTISSYMALNQVAIIKV